FNKDNTSELEISFPKGLGYADYQRLLDYYSDITPKSNITAHDILDISIELINGPTYRISITNINEIFNFIKNNSRYSPNKLYQILSQIKPSDNIETIYKNRNTAIKKYYPEWKTVVKLTQEIPVDTAPKFEGTENIFYRYKSRYTFQI